MSRLLGAVPEAVPGALFPDPGPAHDWLRHELSRPEYQESLLERFTRWFDGVLDAVGNAGSGGFSPVVGLALLALLAGGIAFALSRLRPNPGTAAQDAGVFTQARETSEEHRRRAQAALEQGDWGDAVVESVRAVASGLVERGLVPEQSGITVHELSERAGRLFPDHGSHLEAVSRAFDETRYGDHPADERQARDAVELERELARSAPSVSRDAPAPTAVPR